MFEDKIKQLLDNNNKNTLFKTLYNSYINRKNKTNQQIASNELLEEITANGLNPREALKITKIDISIFIFATLILRMISNQLVYLLINLIVLQIKIL